MATDIWGDPITDKTQAMMPITPVQAPAATVQKAYDEVIELVVETPEAIDRDPDMVKAILYLARCVDQCAQVVAAQQQLPSAEEDTTSTTEEKQSTALNIIAPKEETKERHIGKYIGWGVILLMLVVGIACILLSGGLGAIGVRLGA